MRRSTTPGHPPRALRTGQRAGRARLGAIALAAAAVLPVLASTAQAGSPARPASRSERSAILKVLAAEDGSTSGVTGVYVSRSNSNLALACERTPERRLEAYVFTRSRGRWHLSAYGPARRAGNATDRSLEAACH